MDPRAIGPHLREKRATVDPPPLPPSRRGGSWLDVAAAAGLTLACCAVALGALASALRREPLPELVKAEPAAAYPSPCLASDPAPVVVTDAGLEALKMPAAEKPVRSEPVVELLPRPTEVMVVAAELLAMPAREKAAFKRLNRSTEEELRNTLAGAEEVGIGLMGGSLRRAYQNHLTEVNRPAPSPKGAADCGHILRTLPHTATLPWREGASATLSPRAASELGRLSRKLRVYLNVVAPAGADGGPRDMKLLRERMRSDLRGKKPEWLRAAAVPALTQLLMAEGADTRRLLVDLLAAIPERPATLALARRAVFDLSAEVREAAVEALRSRDPEAWRQELLAALEYPWPAPADFAAEALAHLGDLEAVPDLVARLGNPRPGRPARDSKKGTTVQEVVKIDHLRNCMLCHAPSLGGTEAVLGADAVWDVNGQSRDPVFAQLTLQVPAAGGRHEYGAPSTAAPVLIRADITYLRQDFSVSFPVPVQRTPLGKMLVEQNLPVARALGLAPLPVRFDYVVRTRPVLPAELKKWRSLPDENNPQRDATLLALRELTGRDQGMTTLAWQRAFPNAEREVRTRQLADRLVRADALQVGGLLVRYGEADGAEYTHAIAKAAPKLTGFWREAARLALVSRLAKEPADALRAHLRDGDAEVRRAAVRACVRRDDRELAPDLVPLLDDAATARPAREALRRLTGQELPDAGAWRKWLSGLVHAGG
jgi:hypothetical protein